MGGEEVFTNYVLQNVQANHSAQSAKDTLIIVLCAAEEVQRRMDANGHSSSGAPLVKLFEADGSIKENGPPQF